MNPYPVVIYLPDDLEGEDLNIMRRMLRIGVISSFPTRPPVQFALPGKTIFRDNILIRLNNGYGYAFTTDMSSRLKDSLNKILKYQVEVLVT